MKPTPISLVWVASAVGALAACSSSAKPAAPTAPAATAATGATPAVEPAGNGTTAVPAVLPPLAFAPSAKVESITLAQAGLEATSLDRSADPCADFYQFACGGWVASHPIPDDKPRWGRFGELKDKNDVAIATLMTDAVTASQKGSKDQALVALGQFYGSCMDETVMAKNSKAALAPQFAKLAAVKDAKTWAAAVTDLHNIGVNVVFGASTEADLKDSMKNVMYVDTGALGLPDRDYYFEAKFADKVTAYKAHLERTFTLLGKDAATAKAAAASVVQVETEIAKLTKTGEEKRDIPALYNPVAADDFAKKVTSVPWAQYWKGRGANPGTKLIITTPKFFDALDAMVKAQPMQAWSDYFTYHLVRDSAFAMGAAFDDEMFSMAKVLTGVEKQRERSKRCIDATAGALDHYVGRAYVAKYFPGTSKAQANEMIDAIIAVMGQKIGELDWMSAETKTKAQTKLGKLARMIGYPDKWRTYAFRLDSKQFLKNAQAAARAETQRLIARAGKAVDRSEWLMPAHIVNAYYNPSANNTALPAGILQPPFFGADRSVAANLGGIGMVIGHELTHGFDDQGAQFDADGNLQNWWSPQDAQAFAAKGQCLADQYSTFEALPKQNVNGKLTLGENIADLGGVKMALGALLKLRGSASTVYSADGFSEPQQFFLAVGQAWCDHARVAETERRLKVDVHSPPKFRVFGALRNLPEFAQAFQCKAGAPMRPAKTCAVW